MKGPRAPLSSQAKRWHILTVNVTGWNSLLAQLEAVSMDIDGPQIVCVQEHHRLQRCLPDSVIALRKLGWHAHMTPAEASLVSTEHSITGTAVLVRPYVGMTPVAPPEHPLLAGRVCAVLVNAVLRQGLLVVSIYLDVRHSQIQLLEELAALCAWVKSHRHGYLIAGDYNAEPGLVLETRWTDAMQAHIVASVSPRAPQGER
eukprot:111822-Amphidinium_carterae.2